MAPDVLLQVWPNTGINVVEIDACNADATSRIVQNLISGVKQVSASMCIIVIIITHQILFFSYFWCSRLGTFNRVTSEVSLKTILSRYLPQLFAQMLWPLVLCSVHCLSCALMLSGCLKFRPHTRQEFGLSAV